MALINKSMLDVQTKIHGEAVAVQTATQGCGCGGNATVRMAALTDQQKIANLIERVQKRKNSTYKTQTRLFM